MCTLKMHTIMIMQLKFVEFFLGGWGGGGALVFIKLKINFSNLDLCFIKKKKKTFFYLLVLGGGVVGGGGGGGGRGGAHVVIKVK